MGPFEKTMRVRPQPLSPKGDPLTAAEALLGSPKRKTLFQTKGKSEQENAQDGVYGAGAVRLQAMQMLGPRRPAELPGPYQKAEIAAIWQRCASDPALRQARWDAHLQKFVWPATAGH